MTIHPELNEKAKDRRLTECDDDTCDCHAMSIEEANGSFRYVWSPDTLNDMDMPGMYLRVVNA